MVKDVDFFSNDAARTLIQAAGQHLVGLDFTQDAMPYAALFKAGQLTCYNNTNACLSYDAGSGYFAYTVDGGRPFQVQSSAATA